MRKKIIITEKEALETEKQIYSLLYCETNELYEEISNLARQHFYLESNSQVTIIVDNSNLPNDVALLKAKQCEYFSISNAKIESFMKAVKKSTSIPLLCDANTFYINLLKNEIFERKIFFYLPESLVDIVATRKFLFSEEVTYYSDYKRSEIMNFLRNLKVHDYIYSNSENSTDVFGFLNDFYFFGQGEEWKFTNKQNNEYELIKSFLTESSADSEISNINLADLKKDIKCVNLGLNKKSKTCNVIVSKHQHLTEELLEQFNVKNIFERIFNTLEICYSELQARIFITSTISMFSLFSENELETLEYVLKAVAPLREIISKNYSEIDTYIDVSSKQNDYQVPEVLLEIGSENVVSQESNYSIISD